jgi:hypothetical protein
VNTARKIIQVHLMIPQTHLVVLHAHHIHQSVIVSTIICLVHQLTVVCLVNQNTLPHMEMHHVLHSQLIQTVKVYNPETPLADSVGMLIIGTLQLANSLVLFLLQD